MQIRRAVNRAKRKAKGERERKSEVKYCENKKPKLVPFVICHVDEDGDFFRATLFVVPVVHTSFL